MSELEHDAVLQEIASTDVVVQQWPILRNIIKHKIQQNVSVFLSEFAQPLPPPRPFLPQHFPPGGVKLPPFPPRKNREGPRPLTSIEVNVLEPPVSYMNEQQANEMVQVIFSQLDGFEDSPPFTIQRVCELCVHPTQHYKSVGKYLRAVEKSLLVTSTIDAFPPLTVKEKDLFAGTIITLGSAPASVPSTPLFSPIPFLHEDVRRSKSTSPPLTLGAGTRQKVLGLVDELDDPSPGHLSDHPTPLSSTTRPLFDDEENSNKL